MATGAQDADVTALTDYAELANTGDHTLGSVDILSAVPTADHYLYLSCGAATDADYTAGKLLITLWGV